MAAEHKLSLPTAILININIMMGAGIFINTVELSKRAGLLSGFMYPLIGLLVLPLIIAIASLIKIYPSGGFYMYGEQEISPLVGYISTWSYFIAKLASASLMIHVSVSLITQIFPALLSVGPILFYDLLILSLFICLNLLNMKTGSRIQFGFLALKLLPVLFVITIGLLFFAPAHVFSLPAIWTGIPSCIPLVLYAAMGFEAICAISNKIEDAERNAPKAIMISFATMMILVFLFQFLFYATLGQTLADQPNYLGAFPALLQKLFHFNPTLIHKLQALFHLAIAASALGGCYGILYSNNWNLYILAQNKKIRGWKIFSALNAQAIPYFCIFAEWLFCVVYLFASSGNQVILQQLAALGTALTYTVCVIALMMAYKRNHYPITQQLVPYTALISCLILIGACIRNFLIGGILPLIGFAGLLAFGLLLYTKEK
jgi:amino acid transporter